MGVFSIFGGREARMKQHAAEMAAKARKPKPKPVAKKRSMPTIRSYSEAIKKRHADLRKI